MSRYVIIKILYTYIELNPARWSEYSTCIILQKSLRPLDQSNQHLHPCRQATLLSPDMQSYVFNAVVSAPTVFGQISSLLPCFAPCVSSAYQAIKGSFESFA